MTTGPGAATRTATRSLLCAVAVLLVAQGILAQGSYPPARNLAGSIIADQTA